MKAKPKVSGYYTNNNKKKRIIKPPFKQGLYSYKNTSYNYIPKINNNNFFSYDTPNYSIINIKKDKNNIININNIYMPNEPGNSSLSFSSINLNKYKINNMPNNFDKNEIKEINDSNSIIKNTNLSMNFNLSNHSINNNNKSNPNNTMNKSIIYHDYFKDSLPYEKESRRMIIEFAKLNLNKKKDIKQIIKENNISLKILNQKYAEKDEEKDNDINNNTNNNTNRELFGEAKKQVYLKNLDYYLSQNSTITTEVLNNKNKKFNIENNFLINNKNKKRINILNFLLTPRVLNLIEDSENKKKFIFLIALDEIFFSEGKESYLFQWKNMENNEIENQFNIKLIKNCIENKIFNNRFCLKVENQDSQQEYNYEIETPSNEICNNYVTGINYLLCK
jgi:hypothetical protein